MSARPTRVLATLDLPPRHDGGIATLTDVLATGLHQLGEPVVVYTRDRGADCDRWDEARPYEVVRMRGHSWVRHAARNFAPYVAHIRAKFGAPHLYLLNAQLESAATRLAQRAGLTVVTFVHGLEVTSSADLLSTLRHPDRVVATTNWMRTELLRRGLAAERVAVARPGVHPPTDRGDARELAARLRLGDGPIVLSVGRLVRRKGHDDLIRALPAVHEIHPSTQLLLVGEGRDRGRLEALAAEMGVAEWVRFAGFLVPDDLEAAYRLADLFALPCREEEKGDTEGFGLVFIEAGARALPVIGGRTAGVVEAIEDRQTGVLVEPRDVDALSAAVIDLLADDERTTALGEAGRRRALDGFSPAAYARRILEVGP